MKDILSKLTRLNKGDKLTDAVTADRLNAIQDAIKSLASGSNINQGTGTKITKNSSGVTINSKTTDMRNHIQDVQQFAYFADGIDEVIDSIGQDPGKKTISYDRKRLDGIETWKDGGLHKLQGVIQEKYIGYQSPVIP